MHLSGTGIGDLGDVSLFPMLKDGEPEARFSHQQEEVRPGYYAVTFADTGIRTELTATARTGMHRYTFPAETDTPQLRINLKQGIGWDAWKESKIEMESDTVITGYRYSSGW